MPDALQDLQGSSLLPNQSITQLRSGQVWQKYKYSKINHAQTTYIKVHECTMVKAKENLTEYSINNKLSLIIREKKDAYPYSNKNTSLHNIESHTTTHEQRCKQIQEKYGNCRLPSFRLVSYFFPICIPPPAHYLPYSLT